MSTADRHAANKRTGLSQQDPGCLWRLVQNIHAYCAVAFLACAAVSWAAEGAETFSVRPARFLFAIEHDFLQPSDVAVSHDHRVYVADGVNQCVKVFDENGKFIRAIGAKGDGPGGLLSPLGIAIGNDGKLYVADSGNHRIQVFTASGLPDQTIPIPSTQGAAPPDPVDVAVDDREQRLYIVDNDNHRIAVYSLAQRRFLSSWGRRGAVSLTTPFSLPLAGTGPSLSLTC